MRLFILLLSLCAVHCFSLVPLYSQYYVCGNLCSRVQGVSGSCSQGCGQQGWGQGQRFEKDNADGTSLGQRHRFPPSVHKRTKRYHGIRSLGSKSLGVPTCDQLVGSPPWIERLRAIKAFVGDVLIWPLLSRLWRSHDHKKLLEPSQELAGKECIVTGGSGGIGLKVAAGLAAKGARVTLACRDVSKGEKGAEWIRSEVPGAAVEVQFLDLSDLGSVRKFANGFVTASAGRERELSVLVNNAGYGGGGAGGLTKDGLEWYFQVNHLGHFLLSLLLLPSLLAASRASSSLSRIINLSSVKHWQGPASLPAREEDRTPMLTRATDRVTDGGEYRRSKLFNLLFTFEFNRRFQELNRQLPPAEQAILPRTCTVGGFESGNGSDQGRGGVVSHAVNPGFVSSDIYRHSATSVSDKMYQAWCKTTSQGALDVMAAATGELCSTFPGRYLANSRPAPTTALADNPEIARWLWAESVRLCGEDLAL